MGTTPNYNFNVPVGSDIVNLLTQNNPNWEALDTILKTISNTGVGTATELKTGTVHSLTRSDTDRKVFTFVATTNFVAGETFLLDGEQVTALTASGEQLSTGCYVIGSNVLVSVHDTLLTFYVPESTAKDAQRLGGELPSHYATESDLEDIQGDMSAVEAKLGTGVFQTQAQNAVDAVNELNTHLNGVLDWTDLPAVTGTTPVQLPNDFHDVKVSVVINISGTIVTFDYSLTNSDFDTASRHLIGCSDGSSLNAYCAIQTNTAKTVSLLIVIYNTAYTTSAQVKVSYR